MTEPELIAQFELDADGKPQAIDRGGTKHYRIVLKVAGAPEDAYAVNYKLHESYYDPERESRDSDAGFAERITSFGDYPVQVQLRTRKNVVPISEQLSSALQRGYRGVTTPEIIAAISDIARS
jgi:pYEATS domain-containing protein involved in immunity